MKNTDVEDNSIRWDKTIGRPQPKPAWLAEEADIRDEIKDNPSARQDVLDRARALVALDSSGKKFGGSEQFAAQEVLCRDAQDRFRAKGDYWKDWEK